jgi:hydrogenase/urease accessory protein HupE
MKSFLQYILIPCALIGLVAPVRADIVFPARLEIKEVEEGLFDVRFNLPMVNNTRLKANPVLPPVCVETKPRDIQGTVSEYSESWQVRCDSKDLFGERIQVEGLLGSQTDVILFLDMLDGRSYTTTLKPARAVFVVPEPASWFAISSAAFMAGLRGMLQHFEIVLLLLLLLFSGIGSRKLTIVLAVFILSHALGQYLAQQKWLLLTSYTPILIVLFVAVWAGFMLVKHRENTGVQLQPVWLLMAIVGLANGGANPEIVGIAGLSFAEQQLSFVQYQTGVLAGLLVYCLLSVEFLQIIRNVRSFVSKQQNMIGYTVSILASGLLFYHLSVLLISPQILPQAPAELYIFVIVLGIWIASNSSLLKPVPLIMLNITFAIGSVLGLSNIMLPIGTFVVIAAIFFLGLSLAGNYLPSFRTSLILTAIACLYQGWNTGHVILENLSLPVANLMAASVIALFLFYASNKLSHRSDTSMLTKKQRFLGALVAVVAVLFRFNEYTEWFNTTIATEFALGLIRIPVLAVTLLIATLVLWPRRRKILEHIDISVRKPVTHIICLALAFFLLPVGSFTMNKDLIRPNAFYVRFCSIPIPRLISRMKSSFTTSCHRT